MDEFQQLFANAVIMPGLYLKVGLNYHNIIIAGNHRGVQFLLKADLCQFVGLILWTHTLTPIMYYTIELISRI